jgi:hypothetical protein
MCSACSGEYENPEVTQPDEPETEPEQTADAAALWGARANWANIRMLLEAMGVKQP